MTQVQKGKFNRSIQKRWEERQERLGNCETMWHQEEKLMLRRERQKKRKEEQAHQYRTKAARQGRAKYRWIRSH